MKAPTGLAVLVMALGLSSSGCGCCRIAAELDPTNPDGDRYEQPDDDDPRLNLGNAEYPPGNQAEPVGHDWWSPRLDPKSYHAGYKVPQPNAEQIRTDYRSWARGVGHKKLDSNRFQWRPPRRCFNGLHCVYEQLDTSNGEMVEPITQLFRRRAAKANLSSMDLAALVITFVQEIHYRVPKDEPFGVKPPALVVNDSDGDCDSKSLLAHMILRNLGVASVLISSEAHKHTMLGLALPAPGRSFTWKSRKYAFVELTAKRAPIGFISPKLLRPNDWRVVAMRYRKPGQPPTTGETQDTKKKRKKQKSKRKKQPRGADDIITGGKIRVD